MTPNDVIVEAKKLLQDNQLLRTTPTYSTDTLLGFVNQSIKRMSLLRPDLFTVVTSIPLTPNTVIQALPANAIRFVEAFLYGTNTDVSWQDEVINWESYVGTWSSLYAWETINVLWENDTDKWDSVDGTAVEEVSWERMSRTDKNWTTVAAALPIKFMRNKYNALRFFVYPKPTVSSYLLAEYAVIPDTYDLDSVIDVLPDGYLPVLVDGVLAYVYGIDGIRNSKGDLRSEDCVRSFYKALGLEPSYDSVPDDFLLTALGTDMGMGGLGAGAITEVIPEVATAISMNVAVIDSVTLSIGLATVNAAPVQGTAFFSTNTYPFLVVPDTKIYYEVLLDSAAAINVGIVRIGGSGDPIFACTLLSLTTAIFGLDYLAINYNIGAGNILIPLGFTAVQVGQKVGVALDPVGGKIWFAVNNAWVQGGDPATDVNPSLAFTPTNNLTPTIGMYCGAADINKALTTSKFKSSALTYTPPTGFIALQTALNS